MRLGYIRNDQIVSLFETDRPTSDFPDIEKDLEVIPASAECNMVRDGVGGWKFADPPVQLPSDKERLDALEARIIEVEARLPGR